MPETLLGKRPLFTVLFEIVALWIVSDIGYYILVPLIGDYSTHPFKMAVYYLFWVVVTLINFWAFYRHWGTIKINVSTLGVITLACIGIALYFYYLLPLFPALPWVGALPPPSDLLYASSWYFLPKSIEIALQQLLIVAMVLAFHAQEFSVHTIARWSAVLFGGMHVLLALSGSSFIYVLVFTSAATVAGFIFPYLILRIRNGLIYSYMLQWGFYAVIIVAARMLLIS
jgi:hypothetical protein